MNDKLPYHCLICIHIKLCSHLNDWMLQNSFLIRSRRKDNIPQVAVSHETSSLMKWHWTSTCLVCPWSIMFLFDGNATFGRWFIRGAFSTTWFYGLHRAPPWIKLRFYQRSNKGAWLRQVSPKQHSELQGGELTIRKQILVASDSWGMTKIKQYPIDQLFSPLCQVGWTWSPII